MASAGAKICVIDARLVQHGDDGRLVARALAGLGGGALLGVARVLVRGGRFDREFVGAGSTGARTCATSPELPVHFEGFERALKELYASYTPESRSERAACADYHRRDRERDRPARAALSTHVWRNTAAGNLGGWQVARALKVLVHAHGRVGRPVARARRPATSSCPSRP